MLYNPQVIAKCLSTQATYINRTYGQMFYFTDTNQIWYDTQNGGRVQAKDITILLYERQRNNFIPSNNLNYDDEFYDSSNPNKYAYITYVYVIETNCLYLYYYISKTWQTVYGKFGQTTVAQTYYPEGNIAIINADDVTTNGILNDGSVVVRDANKMICGLLKSDGYTFNIQSIIGGQINFAPSGTDSEKGCLQLNSESETTNLNNDLLIFGEIKTTSKENWNKQYRLITQDINITEHTVLKKGSLIKASSKLGEEAVTADYNLPDDVTIDNGFIATGCKIYKNSVINNAVLKPPFMFDTEEYDVYNMPMITSVPEDISGIVDNTTLVINSNCLFKNTGDSYYISVKSLELLQQVTTVSFADKSVFNVEYIAKEGVTTSARICYNAYNKTVKILP